MLRSMFMAQFFGISGGDDLAVANLWQLLFLLHNGLIHLVILCHN